MTFKLVTPSHWSHIDMAALLGCHRPCRGLTVGSLPAALPAAGEEPFIPEGGSGGHPASQGAILS